MTTPAKQYTNGNVAALVTPTRMRSQKGMKEIIEGLNTKCKELGIAEMQIPEERMKNVRLRENREYFGTIFTEALNNIDLKVIKLNTAAKTPTPESKKLSPKQVEKLLKGIEKGQKILAELQADTAIVRSVYVGILSGEPLNRKIAAKHWENIRELHALYCPRGIKSVGATFPRYTTAEQKAEFINMMEKCIIGILSELTRSTEKLISSNKATNEKIEAHERALATEKRFSRMH